MSISLECLARRGNPCRGCEGLKTTYMVNAEQVGKVTGQMVRGEKVTHPKFAHPCGWIRGGIQAAARAQRTTITGRKGIIEGSQLVSPDFGDRVLDLNTLLFYPYDAVKKSLPIIADHRELQSGEVLRVLIPGEIIARRIEALAREVETEIVQNPENYVTGAILEGGRWLHDEVRGLWPPELNSQVISAHSDIKSRYATKTDKYEIRLLPPPEVVNHKTYLVFEGVADSTVTLRMFQKALEGEPYEGVDLRVALLIDKMEAHLGIPLPGCVHWCLFGMGNHWMVGCGPDVDGRFRDLKFSGLNCIAIYEKLPSPAC